MHCTSNNIEHTRYFAKVKLPVALAVTIILSACSTADKVDTQKLIPAEVVTAGSPETNAEANPTAPAAAELDTQKIAADGEQELPNTVPIANFEKAEVPTQKPAPKPVQEEETLNITLATLRAERGDLESQIALGKAYATGTPRVEKDPAKAKTHSRNLATYTVKVLGFNATLKRPDSGTRKLQSVATQKPRLYLVLFITKAIAYQPTTARHSSGTSLLQNKGIRTHSTRWLTYFMMASELRSTTSSVQHG